MTQKLRHLVASVWIPWRGLAIVLAAASVVFAPSLQFDFVEWDDPIFLTQNPLVVDAQNSSAIDQLLTPQLGYPIPVTVGSYRIENALFGVDDAAPYHVTNVLLHLVAITLLFAVAKRCGLSPLASAFSATVFGLHPAVAESVSWVTGRKELLATAATLGAIWFALEPPASTTSPQKPSSRALALSAILSVVALLSKPTGVCAAIVSAVIVASRLGGIGSRLGCSLAAKVYGLPLLLAIATIPIALINHEAIQGNRHVGGFQLVREAWYALGYHLGIIGMIRPNAAKYLPVPWPPPFDPLVDLLPVVVIGGIFVAYRTLDSQRLPAGRIGLLLAVMAYLPSSNLIPLTRIVADAYVHLSLAGIGLFLGAIVDTWASQKAMRRVVAVCLLAVLTIGVSLRASASSARYRDSLALWSANYAAFPHDYRLCRNLANALYQRRGPAAALAQYRDCATRHGSVAFERNQALMLVELGRFDEAEPLLRAALARAPNDPVLLRRLDFIASRRRAATAPDNTAPNNTAP